MLNFPCSKFIIKNYSFTSVYSMKSWMNLDRLLPWQVEKRVLNFSDSALSHSVGHLDLSHCSRLRTHTYSFLPGTALTWLCRTLLPLYNNAEGRKSLYFIFIFPYQEMCLTLDLTLHASCYSRFSFFLFQSMSILFAKLALSKVKEKNLAWFEPFFFSWLYFSQATHLLKYYKTIEYDWLETYIFLNPEIL